MTRVEIPVGVQVNVGGIKAKCVEFNGYTGCTLCAFQDTAGCWAHDCNPETRSDGKGVIFVVKFASQNEKA